MAESSSTQGWSLALKVAGLIVPILLTMFGMVWGMQGARIDALDDRITRVEQRQAAATDRILIEIQSLRAEVMARK